MRWIQKLRYRLCGFKELEGKKNKLEEVITNNFTWIYFQGGMKRKQDKCE